MHVILSFSSPRCLIIAHLNVIYTKFRCAMITQLKKNMACVGMCACDHTLLTARPAHNDIHKYRDLMEIHLVILLFAEIDVYVKFFSTCF